MSALYSEITQQVLYLTLNRPEKHNAFDEALLLALQHALHEAENNPEIQLIVLQAKGQRFCAGADLNWMQRMANHNAQDNLDDALIFARTLHALYASSKPTLAIVQGSAYGGGVGLMAACDIVLAAESAYFCFSEVKLGLIPAVISPYVINAIGARAAAWLFMTAESITATRAQTLGLIHDIVNDEHLSTRAHDLIQHITKLPPAARLACKRLVRDIAQQPIEPTLMEYTAQLIAQHRTTHEAQQGMHAFLNINRV
jgi:methylglutaconyl-CoA hydratase